MTIDLLERSVGAIAAVCTIVSMMECVADGSDDLSGMRLICGMAVAASAINMFLIFWSELF